MTLSSFTKTVAPGLRIGYVVAPEALATAVGKYAENTYISPCMVSQTGLAAYCEAGYFEPGVERAKQALKARCDAMVESVRAHFPADAGMVVPQGGYFLWIDLGAGADTTALAARAAEAGVPFVKGADFYADGGGTTAMRLAFSAVPPDRIREGIERLGGVIAAVADAAMPLDDLLRRQPRMGGARASSAMPASSRRLEAQQAPRYLWIGCSDSRVPANEITGTDPGEVFVHRNVANVVVHTDLNCLSVLQYAVEVLRRRGDRGLRAPRLRRRASRRSTRRRHGLIDNWLRHVQDVAHEHAGLLAAVPADARADLLCRLNVVEQVTNVCRTTIVQEAWGRGARLTVHGVVYGLADGVLRDLGVSTPSAEEVDARRSAAVARLSAAAESKPLPEGRGRSRCPAGGRARRRRLDAGAAA